MPGCGVAVVVGAVVGGVIGYLTNVVAVWLLFHPVRRRCLLPGGRLCVQGLVAARRGELARRLGGLVDEYVRGSGVVDRLGAEAAGLVRRELLGALRRSPVARGLLPLLGPVVEAVSGAVGRLVSGLVGRVELGRVVEEELLGLEPGRLEELFREAVGRELRFIEASGFVLGALVGAVQGLVLCLVGC